MGGLVGGNLVVLVGVLVDVKFLEDLVLGYFDVLIKV